MFAYFRNLRDGVRARRLAEQFCDRHHAADVVQGSWVCADEPGRFVVRVFCGRRPFTTRIGPPPWRICVIVAVEKTTGELTRIVDDAPYYPYWR